MNVKQIGALVSGLVIIAIGIFLIVDAYSSMHKTTAKIKKEIIGHHEKSVRNKLIGGAVLVVIGGGLFYFVRRHKHK